MNRGDLRHVLGFLMFLSVAVEDGDVDPEEFIGILKLNHFGFVEKIGIEGHRSVLSVGNVEGVRPAFFQKNLNLMLVLVIVVFGKIPVVGCFLIPNNQPA